MSSHHLLSQDLDPRLVKYAAGSWNTYEAIFSLQQLTGLLPSYCQSLVEVQGARGVSAARRAWGVVADLASAVTGMTASYDTLVDLGFHAVIPLGSIKTYVGDLALAESEILRTPFETAATEDLLWLLDAVVAHDRRAKPLLDLFQDELHAWDEEARTASGAGGTKPQTVRDLVRALPDQPIEFPLWDGRPLLLDEQRALLEYLARNSAAEIVADRLVDEPLGRYLLLAAGVLRRSDVAGETIFDIDSVPLEILVKPVDRVCHDVGSAVLACLAAQDETIDPLDQLTAIETLVAGRFSIALGRALEPTRLALIEARLQYLTGNLLDLTDRNVARLRLDGSQVVESFEFPELSSDV